MKILVTLPNGDMKKSFITDATRDRINSMGEVIWNETETSMTKEELCEKIKGVDVVISCWGTPCLDADVCANADKLKILVHLAGSVARFVSEEMFEKGIRVISGNEYFAESVAEGVIGYMIAALRRIPYFSSELKAGRWHWTSFDNPNEGLLDRTVGIVSFGTISEYLVKMLKPFRNKIKLYTRSIDQEILDKYDMERVSLDELFETCDIISVQTALNKHTIGMIDENLLKKIKPGALFVNTARGPVVDEDALARELATGRFHAILDVYGEEPPVESCPFYNLDNVVMMPHQGGPTIDRRKFITEFLLDDVERMFRGEAMPNEILKDKAMSMTVS